jgi:hypothetical protein
MFLMSVYSWSTVNCNQPLKNSHTCNVQPPTSVCQSPGTVDRPTINHTRAWERESTSKVAAQSISQSSWHAALRRERVTARLLVLSWRIRTGSLFSGTVVCSKTLLFGSIRYSSDQTENCPLPSKSSGYDIVRKISATTHVYGDVTLFKAYADLKGCRTSIGPTTLR